MISVDLSHATNQHIQRLVASLADAGWTARQIPEQGRLLRNRQRIVLETPYQRLQLRLSVFKVGKTGRNRPDERRVEITTTYAGGMDPLPDYADIVLGYDPVTDAYVGLDPTRLECGGPTHNASTFVDRGALASAPSDRIQVQAYPAPILGGTEFQGYFRPARLAEYLFNYRPIHANLYLGDGPYAGTHAPSAKSSTLEVSHEHAQGDILVLTDSSTRRRRGKPKDQLVEAFERDDFDSLRKAKLTPEEFEAIRRQCIENGLLGEQRALDFERRRLRKLGKDSLADRIQWVSQMSVGEGYDIKSFNEDGTDRLIEVKATVGRRRVFEITRNEWRVAEHNTDTYFVYQVRRVRSDRPEIELIQNPVKLEQDGTIRRTPTGWIVTLK